MKNNCLFFILVFFLCLPSELYTQKKLSIYPAGKEELIYSTSFETDEDTAGWFGLNIFESDVPAGGGSKSAYISGGCAIPHAWKMLGPLQNAGEYIVRCKAKNLSNGGIVSIAKVEDSFMDVIIDVQDTVWKQYVSEKKLYCPAGGSIVLSLSSGGLIPSAMLVDMIEVFNTEPTNSGWKIIKKGTPEKLSCVVMTNDSTAFAAGSFNTIIKTTNAGNTWTSISPTVKNNNVESPAWSAIRFYDKNYGIAVSDVHAVITSNGGESWDDIFIDGKNFTCIGNTRLDNIYLGNSEGYLFNSVDTGKTWSPYRLLNDSVTQQVTGEAASSVKSIILIPEALNGMTMYALTANALFYKVMQPEMEWKQMGKLSSFSQNNSQAQDLCYTMDGTLFVCGISDEPGFDDGLKGLIIKLGPPDSHWYQSLVGEYGSLNSLSNPGTGIIYTCGAHGMIFSTSNNGRQWNPQYTGISSDLNSIYFFDNSNGFAVGDSGTVLFTNCGGYSALNSPPEPFHLLTPANGDSIVPMRSMIFTWDKAEDSEGDNIEYTFLLSEDTCVTWKSYGQLSNSEYFQLQSAPGMPGKYYWTVIANDGTNAVPAIEVFSFTVYIIAGINEDDALSLSDELYQNYPNPFNPATKIKYELKSGGYVTIKIFDVLGKETAVLINEYKPQGRYEVEWNARNFSSGVYFCTIKAGEFMSTRKLILLK